MDASQPLPLRRRIEHDADQRDRQIHELLVGQIALRLETAHWGSLTQPQSTQRATLSWIVEPPRVMSLTVCSSPAH
jgi:hypothetical protein